MFFLLFFFLPKKIVRVKAFVWKTSSIFKVYFNNKYTLTALKISVWIWGCVVLAGSWNDAVFTKLSETFISPGKNSRTFYIQIK